MQKDHLDLFLDIFYHSRSNMVNDFLNESPEVFLALYKFEKNQQLMSIARDKYFVSWLSNHWNLFQIKIDGIFPHEQQDDIRKEFAAIFVAMLSKWSLLKEDNVKQFELGLTLIQDMQKTFENFIVAGINSDINRNKLNTLLEKNKVIFDRKIEQLENEL